MSTIEDEARAEAEKSITGNGMHVGTITDRLREAFVQGYLAASRREPSDNDEREWEYGYKLIESDTRDVIDLGWPYKAAAAAAIDGEERAEEESEASPDMPRVEFCVVRRHGAGPWEVVPE